MVLFFKWQPRNRCADEEKKHAVEKIEPAYRVTVHSHDDFLTDISSARTCKRNSINIEIKTGFDFLMSSLNDNNTCFDSNVCQMHHSLINNLRYFTRFEEINVFLMFRLFYTFVFILLLFTHANTAKVFGLYLESWKLSEKLPKFSQQCGSGCLRCVFHYPVLQLL